VFISEIVEYNANAEFAGVRSAVGVRREHFALHPAVQDRDISDYECKRGGSPSMTLREAANKASAPS
jgi:hypothetical protein